MPLYRCHYPEGALGEPQRQALAKAFTDIHCELTGAPRTFVHVQFHPGTRAASDVPYVLHAGIRAGRDQRLAQAIVRRCIAAVCDVTGAAEGDVTMRTSSTPASWILEGGLVMPEPGEEDVWIASAGGNRAHA